LRYSQFISALPMQSQKLQFYAQLNMLLYNIIYSRTTGIRIFQTPSTINRQIHQNYHNWFQLDPQPSPNRTLSSQKGTSSADQIFFFFMDKLFNPIKRSSILPSWPPHEKDQELKAASLRQQGHPVHVPLKVGWQIPFPRQPQVGTSILW
jgi:hypothetical protein